MIILKSWNCILRRKTNAAGIDEFIFGSVPIFSLISSHFQFSLWHAFQMSIATCCPQILRPIQNHPSINFPCSPNKNANSNSISDLIKMLQIYLIKNLHVILKMDRKLPRSMLHFNNEYYPNSSLGRWCAGMSVSVWSVISLPLSAPWRDWHILPLERIGHIILQTFFICQT